MFLGLKTNGQNTLQKTTLFQKLTLYFHLSGKEDLVIRDILQHINVLYKHNIQNGSVYTDINQL